MLQDTVGLASASYTEFTTCQAALLVILAQRVCERNSCVEIASIKGIELNKHMGLGLYTASSDKSAIQAMQVAIERPDHQRVEKSGESRSAYDQLLEWAMLWKREGMKHMIPLTLQAHGHSSPLLWMYTCRPWHFMETKWGLSQMSITNNTSLRYLVHWCTQVRLDVGPSQILH